MTTSQLKKQYQKRARAMMNEGWKTTIEPNLDFVCVENINDPDSAYVFQGDSAHDLLATVPDWIDAHTYLLAQATEW
jgi:hypothetical protein